MKLCLVVRHGRKREQRIQIDMGFKMVCKPVKRLLHMRIMMLGQAGLIPDATGPKRCPANAGQQGQAGRTMSENAM